jgi:hypothetical protein
MLEEKKFTKSTFLVRILDCQHASWQGEIIWLGVETSRRQCFRSALEMLHLIEQATGTKQVSPPKEPGKG